MALQSVLFPAITTTVPAGGVPVLAMMGPLTGGLIVNPAVAADQGLAAAENLYVDLVNPAAAAETGSKESSASTRAQTSSRAVAAATLAEVREAMRLRVPWLEGR